ncbi:hypothetical protein B0H19DRAFT_1156163 [Mycena capillaripes]|nr:hypothetical protein B0H19DRAFT_1156163 [Mycena capillaripes]
MNVDFLAGATDVIECFVRELGLLQVQLRAEETRAAEIAEATRTEAATETGLSVLWVTKTALEVTRQRLAQERTAKKTLQHEISTLKMSIQKEQERHKAREAQLEEKVAQLKSNLEEREEALSVIKNDLRTAHQDSETAQSELSQMKTRLAACDSTNLHLHHMRFQFEAAADEQRAHFYTRLAVRDRDLNTTHKQLRLLRHAASAARSSAAIFRARLKTANRNHKTATGKLKLEQAAHEELKFTCRQLIEIVEALEAAACINKIETRHWHATSECKYQKKYEKAKDKNQELKTKLVKLSAEQGSTGAGKRSKKRKAEGELVQPDNKRRVRHSM